MERGFYNEDIEELLKQKADQYRMYPSDKVWKGIQRSLHPSRKWYWVGFVLFLSAIGYYAFVELFAPSTNKQPISKTNSPTASPVPTTNETAAEKTAVIVPFASSQKENSQTTGTHPRQRSFVLNPEEHTTAVIATTTAAVQQEKNTLAMNSEAVIFDMATRRMLHDIHALPVDQMTLVEENQPVTEESAQQKADETAAEAPTNLDELIPTPVSPADGSILKPNKTAEQEDGERVNWLHEMAVYELQMRKPKRVSLQFAFTPTMNYRTLKSNDDVTRPSDGKNLPVATQIQGNPDDLVNHKPALGFEVGSHILYAANKTFTFKGGFQFNYSRYDIQAYSSSSTDRATIALNSSTGFTPNNITSYTNIRNFGGDEVENLRNQYFQLSMPIGVEVNLLGNEKLQVGIAGTLQPTYLMNRNTYLITTDYKNYTREPQLVRRVNLHTSAEAFVAYKTGDLKWQVGPQFRYQLLSSYIREYPIREQLMEFGFKLGVSKTIR